MSELEFWYGSTRYTSDVPNIWTEVEDRWPPGAERGDRQVTESILCDVADPVACSLREGESR